MRGCSMNRDFEAGVAGVFDERLERERPCEIYAAESVETDVEPAGLRVWTAAVDETAALLVYATN